jgi:hypothetical protein
MDQGFVEKFFMPGLVPGMTSLGFKKKDVDGRDDARP